MDKSDFKKLLEETLEPLQNGLDEVKKDLKEVKRTQEAHTGSLMSIEATINGYADAYKTNKANIAGVIPPSEFTIHR